MLEQIVDLLGRIESPVSGAQQAEEADGRLRRPRLIGEALGRVVSDLLPFAASGVLAPGALAGSAGF
jgi:hypothetical protein